MIKAINDAIEQNLDLMINASKDLLTMPETGFKEYKTNEYMKKAFNNLGYEIESADGITGFYTLIDTGRKGPTVLVLAEMDALYCYDHPNSNKETGVAHACGHHSQMAIILGLASALKNKEILNGLCGKIKLCVVPAEEGIEISYRKKLRENGTIKYLSGKQEFIKRGYFDDVDLAFMLHATALLDDSKSFTIKKGSSGIIMKEIKFIGKSAHAGVAPDKGVNALNAASLAMQAVAFLRETFREKDFVRFHPIITKGGDVVSAVPSEVTMESYVRASNVTALKNVNEKINQAIVSAAASIGATVEINDLPGYSPLINDENFIKVALNTFKEVSGEDGFLDESEVWNSGSTDMGDVSCLVPSIHPYVAGAKGIMHRKDFLIENPKKFYSNGLAFELSLLKNLLKNDAEQAYKIIKSFSPIFDTKEEYMEFMDSQEAQVKSEIDYSNGIIKIGSSRKGDRI